jgi:hypothetical protein
MSRKRRCKADVDLGSRSENARSENIDGKHVTNGSSEEEEWNTAQQNPALLLANQGSCLARFETFLPVFG